MLRALCLGLIALCLLTGCATSTQLSPQPMPVVQRPTACLMPCPTLPELESDDEIAMAVWVFDVIDIAGQCRRMHDSCREVSK